MEEKREVLYTEQVEDAHLRDQPNYANSNISTIDGDVSSSKNNAGHNDTFGESEANQVNIEGINPPPSFPLYFSVYQYSNLDIHI